MNGGSPSFQLKVVLKIEHLMSDLNALVIRLTRYPTELHC